jgi:5-methylcytosine-specific restriction endonuclease McrA
VRRALEAAMQRAWDAADVPAGTSPASLRRADALVAVAEQYLTGGTTAGAPPVEVVVHVEATALAEPDAGGTLDDGTSLAPATTDRLLCDATVVEVVESSSGNVLDVGRRRRTIPTLLRRALHLRDRGCRFPGCTNRQVDGHHVVPSARGGATALDNLCSLCRRHHAYVHEHGFRLERDGTGGFRFFRPDGREVPAVGGGAPALPAEPVEALRAQHRAEGIAVDAWTGFPRWDGQPADYDHAVSCLVQQEARPSP